MRRQDVLHLAGADAERQRAERAVRRGVAVPADDGHPRLGQPLLRADDVDDALPAAGDIEEWDAELGAVGRQHRDLRRGLCVQDRQRAVGGRDAVIHRRDRPVRPPHLQPARAQPGECLGRGHLVYEMQINVQDSRAARLLGHDVAVPDFVEECLWHVVSDWRDWELGIR